MSHALRSYLELQADRIEAILASHRCPVHIGGGTCGPEVIQFFLDLAPHTRAATVLALLPVLSAALGQPVDGRRGESGVILILATPPTPGTQRRPIYALEVGQ
ncbi:MAG TPA: DNA translocase FtsK [Anaerolineae bacterium]|nr:DNA translocase FtsK [Anaerolineae bacterium]